MSEITFEPGSVKKTPFKNEWSATIDVDEPGVAQARDRIKVYGATPEQAVHLRDFLLLSIRLAAQEYEDIDDDQDDPSEDHH